MARRRGWCVVVDDARFYAVNERSKLCTRDCQKPETTQAEALKMKAPASELEGWWRVYKRSRGERPELVGQFQLGSTTLRRRVSCGYDPHPAPKTAGG